MPRDCRLIVDDAADGAWNMAVDEALVESAAEGGPPTLRLYRWRATLSLGYFQKYADRALHPPSAGLPCVRRASGGGALVHDRELTYLLALPAGELAGRDTRAMYCEAHRAVIEAVGALGGDPSRLKLCDPDRGASGEGPEPFLCFQRRADGDLLVEGPHPRAMAAPAVRDRYKVCGSAQRQRRGALLQHGGVLLGQSDAAPELPGLAELGVGAFDAGDFAEALAAAFATRLGLRLRPEGLTASERAAAERFRDEKHASRRWVERR